MSISSIHQNLANIDYDYKKPQTYLVFVPVLSLVIQKIQMAKTLPLQEFDMNTAPEKAIEINKKNRHFESICKWHLRGTLVQMAMVMAANTLAIKVFSLFAMIMVYECWSTLYQGVKNKITLIEMGSNEGRSYIKSMKIYSPINIF